MEEILLLLVVFGANVVQALTGFAGTLLSMPLSIKLVGIDTARIVLNFVSLFGSAYIMIVDRKNINWKAIKVAAPWLLAGMIAAPVIYSAIDTESIIYIYGAAIILISLWKMFVKVQMKLPEVTVYLLVAWLESLRAVCFGRPVPCGVHERSYREQKRISDDDLHSLGIPLQHFRVPESSDDHDV